MCFGFARAHFDHAPFTNKEESSVHMDNTCGMRNLYRWANKNGETNNTKTNETKRVSLIPINNYIQAYVHKSILHHLFGNKKHSLKPVLHSLSYWRMPTLALLSERLAARDVPRDTDRYRSSRGKKYKKETANLFQQRTPIVYPDQLRVTWD